MSNRLLKYHCKVCDYKCAQKSHNDSHKLSASHVEKCDALTVKLKENRELFHQYLKRLEISEDDEKTISMLRKEIIDKLSSVYSSNGGEEEEEEGRDTNQVSISLLTELTQFTHGKTEQTLNKICEQYLLNSVAHDDAHIIQIIITNKSLCETKQWKIRTKSAVNDEKFVKGKSKKTETIDVDILSSDAKSQYHTIDKFITKIMMANTKDELPNVLIVCFHKTRINDILTLLQMFCGKTIMMQSTKLKFHLSFDEVDVNLGTCSKFLRAYKDYINVLSGIDLITATPYEDFWSMLKNNGIFQLINPHWQERSVVNEMSYDDYLQNYFQIKDHNHLILNHATNNPLEYIEHVFSSTYLNEELIETPYIDLTDSTRKIIFSPAHLCTEKDGVGSHKEVVDFYIELGWIVFLSNGKFKGFIFPDGSRITIDEFNDLYNTGEDKKEWELRDTLRKWAELYPDKNIAVTGYWTIERGITFQTDGFNFTHAIISDYHTKMLNKLIQLIGRLTGNKKYISNKCSIICPYHVIDTVMNLVNKTIELRKENPENYNASDFLNKRSSIPVKLTFLTEECRLKCIATITGKRNYKNNLHNMLKEGYLAGEIQLEDRNNINAFTGYDDVETTIANVKMYTSEDAHPEARRFSQFNNAFNIYKPTAQTGEVGQYSIDLAKDRYEHNGFVNEVNIAWITFNHA
jgi:hypothetical protein